MTVEVKVPAVGESVTEVTIDKWMKREGEAIERDKTVAKPRAREQRRGRLRRRQM